MLPILLVDDSAEDLELTKRAIAAAKILNPIIALQDGQKCLHYFEGGNGFKDRELPVLLIVDLSMPGMDWVTVLQKLQCTDVAKGSVFVMLSGVGDLKLVQQGYQYGAVTFLMKPFRQEDVLQMFDKIRGINLKKSNGGFIVELENVKRLFPC